MPGPDIPSYAEATTSSTLAASRARSNTGGGEGTSNAEERAGLLGSRYLHNDGRQPSSSLSSGSNYRPVTVEDARGSEDSSFLPSIVSSRRTSVESLAREMHEFDVEDPPTAGRRMRRSRAYHNITKRISSITSSISSRMPRWKFNIRNPFRNLGGGGGGGDDGGGRGCRWPNVECLKQGMLLGPAYRVLAIIVLLFFLYLLVAADMFNFRSRAFYGQVFDPATVQRYAIDHVQPENIQHYLQYLSSFPHVAGTAGDDMLRKYIEGEMRSFGLSNVETRGFHAYLDYPQKGGRGVEIIKPEKEKWKAQLDGEGMALAEGQMGVFHGYSHPGSAEGHLMYANFGDGEDFERLSKKGVSFKDAVVLVRSRRFGQDVGAIIRRAEEAGARAVLVGAGNWNAGEPQPPRGSVNRGSVAMMSLMVGDPLTPGFASSPDGWATMPDAKEVPHGEERPIKDNPYLPKIPSMPINREDALHLVHKLEGQGVSVSANPGAPSFWSGDRSSSPTVRVQNSLVDRKKQKVTNILGYVEGFEQRERPVIVGNHRDAWCVGAAHPNSGTAVQLELARLFADMMAYGWRPLRTIIFANWDAGNYNALGSTEWIESDPDERGFNDMVYLTLASAVSGHTFTARGSPLLEQTLRRTLGRFTDPISNTTLAQLFASTPLLPVGAGGDYAAFQHVVGTPSLDISFIDPNTTTLPGSCHDTYERLIHNYDSDYTYHTTMTQVLATLILEFADGIMMPMNTTHYAKRVSQWYDELETHIDDVTKDKKLAKPIDLSPLKEAVQLLANNTVTFDSLSDTWNTGKDIMGFDEAGSTVRRTSHNSRMGNLEHHLLEEGGTWGRAFWKHVLFAPSKDNGNEVTYFPSIRDAVDAGRWEVVQEQVRIVAGRVRAAGDKILN